MSSAARVYALVATVLVFFVAWAAIAARPWVSSPASGDAAQAAALSAREAQLRAEAVRVQRIVDTRWASYRKALARRQQQIADIRGQNALIVASANQPRVQVTTQAPVTATRTS